MYRLLAQADVDWSKWYIYYGDERCLPADHADRNSMMANQAFLEKVAIPEAQIFTISAELGPEQAAKKYQHIVASALPFDMVLLGMGEDGHTASLFPGGFIFCLMLCKSHKNHEVVGSKLLRVS